MASEKGLLALGEAPPSYTAVPSTTSPIPTGVASAAGPPPRPRLPLPLEIPSLTHLRTQRVILASASPRRKQLLAQLGLPNPEILPSGFSENLSKDLSPFEYALQTATQKCMNVYSAEIDNTAKGEPALVIAADTVVLNPKGEILGKPRGEKEHVAMLRGLVRGVGGAAVGEDEEEGTKHKVYTAVAVMAPLKEAVAPGYALETCVEETVVWFDKNLTDDFILSYVRTREGADKAGGYGIQGIGALLVSKIEGTHDNVVGLPLRATLRLIEKVLAAADGEDEGSVGSEAEGSD